MSQKLDAVQIFETFHGRFRRTLLGLLGLYERIVILNSVLSLRFFIISVRNNLTVFELYDKLHWYICICLETTNDFLMDGSLFPYFTIIAIFFVLELSYYCYLLVISYFMLMNIFSLIKLCSSKIMIFYFLDLFYAHIGLLFRHTFEGIQHP